MAIFIRPEINYLLEGATAEIEVDAFNQRDFE
jgi:hypothetical protein